MVIFHSYVKLPEGSFSQELCFLSFALETLSILCYDIYIYICDMLCNSVRLHDLSWKPLLLQVEFHISEPETRPPHAVDVMLPPGTRDGQRNGLTTRLKVNKPAIWEYWIVAHGGCDAYVYHYYSLLLLSAPSLLFIIMAIYGYVYPCLSLFIIIVTIITILLCL